MQIKLGHIPDAVVVPARPARDPTTTKPWPANCNDVNGDAITAAIATGEVGYMHLNGKRLGNLSAMEAIPNSAIIGFQDAQRPSSASKLAGEIIWNAGSRDGYKGDGPEGLQVQEHRRIASSAASGGSATAPRSRTRWPMPRSSR